MFHSVSLLSQAPLARGSRALPSVLLRCFYLQYTITGLDWWTGLVDRTGGQSFNHKNLISPPTEQTHYTNSYYTVLNLMNPSQLTLHIPSQLALHSPSQLTLHSHAGDQWLSPTSAKLSKLLHCEVSSTSVEPALPN